jgi:hypothetical protein
MSRSLAFLAAVLLVPCAASTHESDGAPRAGLRVHVDPATGQVLDEAPPATAQSQLDESGRARTTPDFNRVTLQAGARGTVLLNLNGQVRMYSIARVKPDGDIEEQCVTGAELAAERDGKQ